MAKITANALCKIDNSLIFSDKYSRALFRYDLNQNRCKYLGLFDDENDNNCHLYYTTLIYGDRVIFLPYLAGSIGVYDYRHDTIENIRIPGVKKNAGLNRGVFIEDDLILFGSFSKQVLTYCFRSNRFETIFEGSDPLQIEDAIVYEGKAYAVSSKRNSIFVIEPRRGIIDYIELENGGYTSITMNDNEMILTPYSTNAFAVYNFVNKRINYIDNPYGKSENSYRFGVLSRGVYYAIPGYSIMPVRILLDGSKIEKDIILESFFGEEEDCVGTYTISDGIAYMFRQDRNELLIYNTNNNDVTMCCMECDINVRELYFDRVNEERKSLTVSDFLNGVTLC